jgi:hypothetical protein
MGGDPGLAREEKRRAVTIGRPRMAALGVGLATGFVSVVALARRIGPALLVDTETSWSPARLALGLSVLAGAAAAGAAAAAVFDLWARSRGATDDLAPLPFRAATLAALTLVAILTGTMLRFAGLARVPEWLWVDDLSLIRPALELTGRPSDFADAIRPLPYGVAKPYGSIGVLYLEGYRAALALGGTTVLGVRLPSAVAGAASLATAALLGRALLPAGGGMLAALVLAGLRWHLILSRWSFNMILLAPIVDLATLLLLAARRRRRLPLALAAGIVGGVGAHVYLSAWPAGAALGLFALWPAEAGEKVSSRLARASVFALGFAACAAPLFLLREGRAAPYFARTRDHNVLLEIRRTRSLGPPVEAIADALVSPWLLADPTPRHDLPGRSRLGWLLGLPVAIALGRALLRPRDALSGLLLAHAAAFLAAVAAGGQADNPNGSRFAYLSTVAAVAAAAGILWIVGLVPARARRAAALAAVGAVAVHGALSARAALMLWPAHPETFRGFHGQDTLIGRAAARWSRYGEVEIARGLGRSPLTIEAVRRHGLDPDLAPGEIPPAGRRCRIVPASERPGDGERPVERVADPWGRIWAVVHARRAERPGDGP